MLASLSWGDAFLCLWQISALRGTRRVRFEEREGRTYGILRIPVRSADGYGCSVAVDRRRRRNIHFANRLSALLQNVCVLRSKDAAKAAKKEPSPGGISWVMRASPRRGREGVRLRPSPPSSVVLSRSSPCSPQAAARGSRGPAGTLDRVCVRWLPMVAKAPAEGHDQRECGR